MENKKLKGAALQLPTELFEPEKNELSKEVKDIIEKRLKNKPDNKIYIIGTGSSNKFTEALIEIYKDRKPLPYFGIKQEMEYWAWKNNQKQNRGSNE